MRHAIRRLFINPGFTAITVAVLSLGVGMVARSYSEADVILLRPVLLPDFERVVTAGTLVDERGFGNATLTVPDWIDTSDSATTVDHLSLVLRSDVNVGGPGSDPEIIPAAHVTASFFGALKATPILGQTLPPDEDRVAVILERLWERRFSRSLDVLNQTIEVNGVPHRIVGVLASAAQYPPVVEIWTPLAMTATRRADRATLLPAIARLKPGVTVEQARDEFRTIVARLRKEHPLTYGERFARVRPLRDALWNGPEREIITVILSGAILFLVLSTANVANVHYTRISGRVREMAIRAALGAGRLRLVREVLTESLVLGVLGGGLGLLLAWWDLDRKGDPLSTTYLPGVERLTVHPRVALTGMLAAAMSCVAAGLLAALAGTRADVLAILGGSGRSSSAGPERRWLRSILVVGQVALATILVAAMTIQVRGFTTHAVPRAGIDARSLFTMRINLSPARYPETASQVAFARQLQERLAAIPGTETVALSAALPYTPTGTGGGRMTIEGRPGSREAIRARTDSITPARLRLLNVPIVGGRGFDERDREGSPSVAVVNEAFARRHFASEDPVGKRVRIAGESGWTTIIGVAGNIRYSPQQYAIPDLLYRPFPQAPARNFYALVQARPDGNTVASAARDAVYAVDPAQPVFRTFTYDVYIRAVTAGLRGAAEAVSLAGALSLLLALLSIYGVVAYVVNERTHEIGVRMALGASRPSVEWAVVRNTLALGAIGVAIGLVGAVAWTRTMYSVLPYAPDSNLAAYLLAAVVSASGAVLASWIPARRAAQVDPAVALRSQ